MAGAFLFPTTSFATNPALGVDGSALQTSFYAGGVMKYVVFEPSATAIAAAGWAGRAKIPCIVQFQGSGTGNLTGLNVDEYGQMDQITAPKLGYNASSDISGGAQTPDQNWPTYVIYPQGLSNVSHDVTGSEPSASNRTNRSRYMIAEACIADAATRYPIDLNCLIGVAFSAGTSALMSYTYSRMRWPSQFKYDFACQILISGSLASNGSTYRNLLPWMEQNENSTNQTLFRMAAAMEKYRTQTILFNSTGDDQGVGPVNYDAAIAYHQLYTPIGYRTNIAGGYATSNVRYGGTNNWLTIYEYTGVNAPGHQGTWDLAMGNNALGGGMSWSHPLWQSIKAIKPSYRINTMPYRAGAHRGSR